MENSVIKAIETRRSVRSFSQKAIPEELLDAVLKAGTYAPTGGGRQSPVIVAVKDAAYRDKIARLNAEVMGKDTDPYYGAPVIILVLFSTHITTDPIPSASALFGYTESVKFLTARKEKNY